MSMKMPAFEQSVAKFISTGIIVLNSLDVEDRDSP